MLSFEERVAWVLNKIKERDRLNNVQVSKILEVDKNTVQLYCHAKGNIKGSALAKLVTYFKINGEWLISGKSEPFPGACEKFPEVCGPPGVTEEQYKRISSTIRSLVNENLADCGASDVLFSSDQKINIEEAMGKAYKILTAGTALSVALYMNIQQFAAALDTGQSLQICQEQIKAMQTQIDALHARIDRLTAPSTAERQEGDGSAKKAM